MMEVAAKDCMDTFISMFKWVIVSLIWSQLLFGEGTTKKDPLRMLAVTE